MLQPGLPGSARPALQLHRAPAAFSTPLVTTDNSQGCHRTLRRWWSLLALDNEVQQGGRGDHNHREQQHLPEQLAQSPPWGCGEGAQGSLSPLRRSLRLLSRFHRRRGRCPPARRPAAAGSADPGPGPTAGRGGSGGRRRPARGAPAAAHKAAARRHQPPCERRPSPRLNLQPMSEEAPPRAAAVPGSGSFPPPRTAEDSAALPSRRVPSRGRLRRSPRARGERRRESGGCPAAGGMRGGSGRAPRRRSCRPSARCRRRQRNGGGSRPVAMPVPRGRAAERCARGARAGPAAAPGAARAAAACKPRSPEGRPSLQGDYC